MKQFETLESRRFLSAVLHTGILTVRGQDGMDNTITASLNGSNQIEITINGAAAQDFDVSQVQALIIRTYSGNDTISVTDVGVNTWIASGAGNDVINTGSERDFIYGQTGNDVINTGDGRNFVDAGDGADSVTGGANNDLIFGGNGNDTVHGGGGNDAISGGAGDDNLSGDDGNDIITGGLGNDTIDGGNGNDRLWGQSGQDSITGDAGNDVLGGVLGTNTLMGGDGKDTFVVKTSLSGQSSDFDPNMDVLKAVKSDAGSSET
jgi:Ca2+-binding RTX toxin-like protein